MTERYDYEFSLSAFSANEVLEWLNENFEPHQWHLNKTYKYSWHIFTNEHEVAVQIKLKWNDEPTPIHQVRWHPDNYK